MASRRVLAVAATIAAALVSLTATPAFGAAPRACSPATTPRTYAYAKRPGVSVNLTSLDVWAPSRRCTAAGRRAPVVVWVHGGGYVTGDKANAVRDKVRLFNARGWLFVSVNYRLTRGGDRASARYPDHFRDVAAAVAYTRARASRWGGDPRRIAVLGHSAGADIVSNVTTNPTWLGERKLPLRAVRCAGPLDTEGFDKTRGGDESALWRNALGNNPTYRTDTSATLLIRPDRGIPRTITVVRGAPRRRSIQSAFAGALQAAGVPTTVIVASGLSHQEVSRRIGAPGDRVMTPPLVRFLSGCFGR